MAEKQISESMQHHSEDSAEPRAANRRLTAADFPPAVMRLFDQYVHGDIGRRGFLDAAARHAAGGAAGAAAMLAALSPNFAAAQKVKPDDKRLDAAMVEFPSPQGNGKGRGYLVRPAGAATSALPLVLVVHENRGLNPHIEDITRRLALDRFIAFAPDALAPVGGYPGDEDKARAAFATLDQAKTRADFVAAAAFLRGQSGSNGRMGAVGFCYGGGMVNWLATQLPDLAAAVPFYGVAAPLDAVGRIKAELLLVFAADDERINATWPPYEAALKKAGVKHRALRVPGTQHGFNNDTTPRYDEAAARQAWGQVMEFFERTLR